MRGLQSGAAGITALQHCIDHAAAIHHDQHVLLDAQRTLFASELLLIEVRLSEVVNRVALYKALGGGG